AFFSCKRPTPWTLLVPRPSNQDPNPTLRFPTSHLTRKYMIMLQLPTTIFMLLQPSVHISAKMNIRHQPHSSQPFLLRLQDFYHLRAGFDKNLSFEIDGDITVATSGFEGYADAGADIPDDAE